MFPRPVAGALRPIVHGQTVKYNLKKRYGRGFTMEELKVSQAAQDVVHSTSWLAMGSVPVKGCKEQLVVCRRQQLPLRLLAPLA